ncbi:hypothetical protein IG631_02684 [Alternaria alternata]|nr:hypothetical protein IG631_02684 [Alternaria alternata]
MTPKAAANLRRHNLVLHMACWNKNDFILDASQGCRGRHVVSAACRRYTINVPA